MKISINCCNKALKTSSRPGLNLGKKVGPRSKSLHFVKRSTVCATMRILDIQSVGVYNITIALACSVLVLMDIVPATFVLCYPLRVT